MEDRSNIQARSHLPSSIVHLVFFLLISAFAQAAEPYVITIQRLELKKTGGEWVKIIEPDHPVDLRSTDAAISFFNNGRVPAATFDNFRVTYDDHGQSRQLSRKQDFEEGLPVKKGSFVNVTFLLDLESGKVDQLRLTVDEDQRVDSGDDIEMKG